MSPKKPLEANCSHGIKIYLDRALPGMDELAPKLALIMTEANSNSAMPFAKLLALYTCPVRRLVA